MFTYRLFILFIIFLWQPIYGGNLNTSDFPLQMLNLSNKDIAITFEKDVGLVYLDEILEDNTIIPPKNYSRTYGVIFAPRDRQSSFKIVFKGEHKCIFKINYFKFPETPPVSITGEHCDQAGYRVENNRGLAVLVLYIS